MNNLEHNEKQLRLITSFMNNIIPETAILEKENDKELIQLYQNVIEGLCDIVRPLENKIHLEKLDIAIQEGDMDNIDIERKALDHWSIKEANMEDIEKYR